MSSPTPRRKIKPVYLYVGGGALAIGVYFWYSRKSAANAAAAAATTTTDATGTDTTAADALYNDTGYDSGYSDYGSGYSPAVLSAYQDPATGGLISGTGTTQVITAPSTNSQWVQQAVLYLETIGIDPATAGAALGKYVLGLGLTDTELSVVESAIGAEGTPPQSVPAPHLTGTTGQTGTTPAGPVNHPISGTFIRNVVGGAIYQIDSAAKVKYHVTVTTWARLNQLHEKPNYTDVLPTDARLRYPTKGNV